jgi:exonuclease SbcD
MGDPLRILHTSDWHLGIRHGPASRAPDHAAFLAWITDTLRDEAVDALVIAGDVFDSMQPSADTLSRWYRFLAGVSASGVRQVVVVGGNHDSAARLEAPADVLGALDVHVVGAVGLSDDSRARCIVPLKDRAGAVGAVCLAVPYVHEFRLGVRTTDLDHGATREAFRARFRELYAALVDEAAAAFPGVPLVATGHLTVGTEATREDYPHEIHQVGTLDALPVDVFDPRIQYVALGHIHRCYPIGGGRRVWYSGSPVAFSLPEARTPRRVLRVDLDPDPAGAPTVEKLDVPAVRALLELRAEPESLVDTVRTLTWPEPEPPLLFCRAVGDTLPADLPNRLHEALAAHPDDRRPVLAELRQERSTPIEAHADDAPLPALADLTPADVFATLCQSRGIPQDDPVFAAFAQLSSARPGDFDAMIRDAREGTA